MLGQRTQNNPTLGSTPPQEGVEAKVVPPPILHLGPCIGSISIPTFSTPPTQEDFGRDKDLKTLLKSLQPRNFSQEGDNVFGILEEWIIEMEDYFALVNTLRLAKYNSMVQGIMRRAKLTGPAKLWWKLNCQSLAGSVKNFPTLE